MDMYNSSGKEFKMVNIKNFRNIQENMERQFKEFRSTIIKIKSLTER